MKDKGHYHRHRISSSLVDNSCLLIEVPTMGVRYNLELRKYLPKVWVRVVDSNSQI